MTRNVLNALAVAALLISPAQAQGVVQQTSVKVFYGDLDLSKPAGMQTLQRRLKSASRQVCGDSRGALRIGTNDQAHCTDDAVANALAAVGRTQNRVVADNGQKPAR
jgi:UrcA family protein